MDYLYTRPLDISQTATDVVSQTKKGMPGMGCMRATHSMGLPAPGTDSMAALKEDMSGTQVASGSLTAADTATVGLREGWQGRALARYG